MSRWLSNPGDLDNVVPPPNASKSRDAIGSNVPVDPAATARAAVLLNYQFHGSQCQQCGNATDESLLCPTGRQLYQRMRSAGVVS